MTRTNRPTSLATGAEPPPPQPASHQSMQATAALRATGVDYLVAILSSSNSSIAKTFAPGLSAHA